MPSETVAKETSRPQAMPNECKPATNTPHVTYAVELDPDTEI